MNLITQFITVFIYYRSKIFYGKDIRFQHVLLSMSRNGKGYKVGMWQASRHIQLTRLLIYASKVYQK